MSRQSALYLPVTALVMLAGALCSHPALAGYSYGNSFIAWDKCYADGGADSKSFSCDANDAAPQVLVVSFQLSQPMPGFDAMDGRIAVMIPSDAADQTLPDWWRLYNAGACRASALTIDNDFSAIPPGRCRSAWNGPAFGGIGQYALPTFGNHYALLTFGFVPAVAETLAANRSYEVCRLVIDNHRTSGADACAGCGRPMCITLDHVTLYANDFATEEILFSWIGFEYGHPSTAGWNCGETVPAGVHGGAFACVTNSSCASTPVRNRTWGQIKALYR